MKEDRDQDYLETVSKCETSASSHSRVTRNHRLSRMIVKNPFGTILRSSDILGGLRFNSVAFFQNMMKQTSKPRIRSFDKERSSPRVTLPCQLGLLPTSAR